MEWLGSSFKGSIDGAGTVTAVTMEAMSGWADRQITGTLPTLTIAAARPDTKLSCPNGQVQLQKRL